MINGKNKEILSIKTIAGFSGEIWLTVTEVSCLNGLNVATIREACAEREGSYRGGRYIFRKIGKRYEILLTSLPEYIQAEYWIKNSKPVHSTLPALTQEKENHIFDLSVYEAIADTYSRKSAGIKEKAQRKVYICSMNI